MSSEETVKQVRAKADEVQTVAFQIIDLCDLAQTKHEWADGETFELTQAQIQWLIQRYQPLKTKLEGLVEALP